MALNIMRKLFNKLGDRKADMTGDDRYRGADSGEYIKLIDQTREVEAETRRLQQEANVNAEVANQYEEKGRRASMFAENNGEISNSGNGSMLSGLTGFAKLRRKVLGSLGSLGSSDEKLGG